MDFSFKETINPPAKKIENVFDTLSFYSLKKSKRIGSTCGILPLAKQLNLKLMKHVYGVICITLPENVHVSPAPDTCVWLQVTRAGWWTTPARAGTPSPACPTYAATGRRCKQIFELSIKYVSINKVRISL